MPSKDPARGRTIREAIEVCLEGLPGDLREWSSSAERRGAMRAHVLRWVHEYARVRGVVLSDSDILSELQVMELEEGKGR